MKILLALFLSTLAAAAQINPVNIGTTNNDGTGDSLRVAFGKINTNFYFITNSAPIVTATNWITGQLYTNATARPWYVSVSASVTLASVAGGAAVRLQTAPQGSALATIASFGQQTIIGDLATTNAGVISGMIISSNVFSFTNSVAGAGNSALNLPGTGQQTQY